MTGEKVAMDNRMFGVWEVLVSCGYINLSSNCT